MLAAHAINSTCARFCSPPVPERGPYPPELYKDAGESIRLRYANSASLAAFNAKFHINGVPHDRRSRVIASTTRAVRAGAFHAAPSNH